VNGFHVQGMTENKSDAFASTEIREPVPGENTFNGDDRPGSFGRQTFEIARFPFLHLRALAYDFR